MEWLKILICVFVLTAAIGIALGLYLTKHSESLDDEDYEYESYKENYDGFDQSNKGK